MGRLSRVDWTETSWCWVVFLGDPGRWVELVVCSAQHWCRNPGNESHNGLGSLVVPCYGLSARYFPFWRVGLGSCRPLPASRGEAWNVHGVAHVVTGPCPGGAAALPWVYLLCLLLSAWLRPVRHSWCTVYIFEHFVDVSNHLTCLSALDLVFGACWTALYVVGVSLFCEAGSAVSGLVTRQLWWPWFACLAAAWEAFGFVHCILDGATRGRCLIVLWGRERCVSGLAFGTRQLWWPWVACLAAAWEAYECVHYIIIDFVSSMYGHWYWRTVVRGPSFWISRAGESGAWSTWRGPWAAGRLEWRVNAGCVDVYIRELDARGA